MEIAAIIFVLFMLAVAAITFFVLKRAIKMAIRALIVLLILVIAVVGGFALWNFNSDSNTVKKPVKTKKSRK